MNEAVKKYGIDRLTGTSACWASSTSFVSPVKVEPKTQEVAELITGADKVIKNDLLSNYLIGHCENLCAKIRAAPSR